MLGARDPLDALLFLALLMLGLLVLGLVVSFFPEIRCWWRGKHRPERNPLGGFDCLDCGYQGLDLYEMGYPDSGYVTPGERKKYVRVGEEDYK